MQATKKEVASLLVVGKEMNQKLDAIQDKAYDALGKNLEIIAVLDGPDALESIAKQAQDFANEIKEKWDAKEERNQKDFKKFQETLEF